jgi:hypothetical protein
MEKMVQESGGATEWREVCGIARLGQSATGTTPSLKALPLTFPKAGNVLKALQAGKAVATVPRQVSFCLDVNSKCPPSSPAAPE